MTSSPWRAACRLRIVTVVAMAVMISSLGPAASTAFAQSELYPGAVGLVANTGGEPVLLRETPSFEATVLSSFPEGTPADILEGPLYSADGVAWVGVSVGGVTGYIVAGYIQATESGLETGQAPAVVELAQEAGPLAAPEMAPAETMVVEATSAESLTAPAASPSEVPANPVTTADLNLRAGPSFGDAVLLVIPTGSLLAPTGEWSQGFVGVTYEGYYGWVDSGWLAADETAPQLPAAEATKDVSLMQEEAPAPITTSEVAPTKDAALTTDLAAVTGETAYATDVVNLRAGPSESTEVLRVLPEGGPVTITGVASEGWVPVWYNSTPGYISADLLTASTAATDTTSAPVSLAQEAAPAPDQLVTPAPVTNSGTGELMATTLSDVNLRGAPEMTAPVMGAIPPGATLTPLAGPEQGFYQVQYGDQVGWVSAEFLEVSTSYLQRDNLWSVVDLKLHPGQEQFVADNVVSISNAYVEPTFVPLGVYAGDELVGFAMYGQHPDTGAWWVIRLMIDREHQGKGYGREAMKAVIAMMAEQVGCDEIVTSFVPSNAVAAGLYESLGFLPTGEIEDDEPLVRLRLADRRADWDH